LRVRGRRRDREGGGAEEGQETEAHSDSDPPRCKNSRLLRASYTGDLA
jgi:hypothetical protein